MMKENVAWLSEETAPFQRWQDALHLPATDNEPGAPEALLKANKIFRARRWPAPYDRTRHEMILGDARDLRAIPNESVHLVVTSPPYFNLKPYASDAGGRVIGYIVIMDEKLDSRRGRIGSETWIDYFEACLARIAIRKAPLWNQGLLEGAWVIRIDTRNPPEQRIVRPSETHEKGVHFFRALLSELYLREPTLQPA
jgi:hypothetical protein